MHLIIQFSIILYFYFLFFHSQIQWQPHFLFQSFFFNPIRSQFQNYCFLVPILPYVFQFQEISGFNLNAQTYNFQANKQEMGEIGIQNIQSTMELQKLKNITQEQQQKKILQQIVLEAEKARDQIQLEQISNNQRVASQNSRQNQKNQVFGNFNKKIKSKISKSLRIQKNHQKYQDEYQPFQKKRKCESNFKENQNRNIIPNQVNQIFSYIQKISKSKYVVNRIFSKYPPNSSQYNMKRFYLYQSLLKEKVSNYINEGSLVLVTELYEPRCEVYSEEQQRYYNKICRILINHFLQQDSIFNILTSRRMHKDKKKSHLEMRRVLKNKVVEILRH